MLNWTNPLDIVIILNGRGVKPAINSIKVPDKRPASEDNYSLKIFASSDPKNWKILIPISLKKM